MTEERVFWGIHAGKTGDAETLFLKKKVIAIGWPEMGDLSKLAPNREAFKDKCRIVYPKAKTGAIPINAGQQFRFVYEMKPGDYVLYSSKIQKKIYIGEVIGNYQHVEARNKQDHYLNQRAVKWIKNIPRTKFSQGALYELGSACSLFQVKNYADEYEAALLGQQIIDKESEADDMQDYANTALVTQQTTEDFILKTLARELKGHPMADFVAHLLKKMDYNTRVSPEGPDGGIDIVAHRDELGFEPPIIKVQVKSTEGNIGDPVVSSLYGKVDMNEFGMFVTLGGYTKQATEFAKNKSNLRLIDGEELVRLVLAHYEDFDSKYKGILPLRRVYVPEVLSEDEE